jgi:tRNA uridine 5-carboxymethylaminomethyl modification enzyme
MFVLRRDEAYIGVLIDDLVTKGTKEPYRMLTSRAEFRLLLRHDNADLRLTDYGHKIGLIAEERYQSFQAKREAIETETENLKNTIIYINNHVRNKLIAANITMSDAKQASVLELMKRPEAVFETLRDLMPDQYPYDNEIYEQIEITVKYEGYIKKAIRDQERFKKEEAITISETIDYDEVPNLAIEARGKLKQVRPLTLGQASRISGVNPADIQMLLLYIRTAKKRS